MECTGASRESPPRTTRTGFATSEWPEAMHTDETPSAVSSRAHDYVPTSHGPLRFRRPFGEIVSQMNAEEEMCPKRRRLWHPNEPTSQRLGFAASLRLRETGMARYGKRVELSYWSHVKDFCSPETAVFHFPSETMGTVPPFACAFSKTERYGHLLAAADEDGNINLIDTLRCRAEQGGMNDLGRYTWRGHTNAIFDLAWADTDSLLATASGDHTLKLWNVAHGTSTVFRGHTSSVKSVSFRLNDPHVFASGARDGNVLVWDKRNAGTSDADGDFYHKPCNTIRNAHVIVSAPSTGSGQRRRRRTQQNTQDSKQSVTSVCFLKDTHLLATAGAADGVIKVWDLRRTYTAHSSTPQPVMSYPYVGPAGRRRGFTHLSLDSTGQRLLATCTDSSVYMYDTLHTGAAHVRTYRRDSPPCSFYVRSVFSPDDRYIISGSTDKAVYMWDVNQTDPVAMLEGHEGEVTAVAWCPSDLGKIVSSADDTTLRIWTMEPSRPPADNDNKDYSSVKILVKHPALKWRSTELDNEPLPVSTSSTPMPHIPHIPQPSTTQSEPTVQSGADDMQVDSANHNDEAPSPANEIEGISNERTTATTPFVARRRIVTIPTTNSRDPNMVNPVSNLTNRNTNRPARSQSNEAVPVSRTVVTQSNPLHDIGNRVSIVTASPQKQPLRLVDSDIRSFWNVPAQPSQDGREGGSPRKAAVVAERTEQAAGQENQPMEIDQSNQPNETPNATQQARRLPFRVKSISSYFQKKTG